MSTPAPLTAGQVLALCDTLEQLVAALRATVAPPAPAAEHPPHTGEEQGQGEPTPAPPAAPQIQRPRWTKEEIATLRRMRAAGAGGEEIAAALGCKPQRVYDKMKHLPGLPPRGRPPRPVPLPDPAARQVAEDAAAAVVADADIATVREWLRTHARIAYAPHHPPALIVADANRHRAVHGLPPFRLTTRAGDAA